MFLKVFQSVNASFSQAKSFTPLKKVPEKEIYQTETMRTPLKRVFLKNVYFPKNCNIDSFHFFCNLGQYVVKLK